MNVGPGAPPPPQPCSRGYQLSLPARGSYLSPVDSPGLALQCLSQVSGEQMETGRNEKKELVKNWVYSHTGQPKGQTGWAMVTDSVSPTTHPEGGRAERELESPRPHRPSRWTGYKALLAGTQLSP